jgi:hypothetical protein
VYEIYTYIFIYIPGVSVVWKIGKQEEPCHYNGQRNGPIDNEKPKIMYQDFISLT